MPFAAILTIAGLYNFSTSLSFSSINLKKGSLNSSIKPIFLFVFLNLAFIITGLLTGSAIKGLLADFSLTAGGALIIVVATKTILKGWKTKPLSRIFDISRLQTMIWLLIAVNIDTFLICTASSLLTEINTAGIILVMAASSLTGIASGIIPVKRLNLLLPNILELTVGLAMLVMGIISLIP